MGFGTPFGVPPGVLFWALLPKPVSLPVPPGKRVLFFNPPFQMVFNPIGGFPFSAFPEIFPLGPSKPLFAEGASYPFGDSETPPNIFSKLGLSVGTL